MLVCPGEGCNYRAKTDRALSTHLRQCQKAATGLASVAHQIEQHGAHQQQVKWHRVSSVEPLEDVPEVEESMDVDLEVSIIEDAPENRHLTSHSSYQDNSQPDRDSPPSAEVLPPPVNAPTPSTSRYGRICHLPLRYEDMEIDSHEIGPGLSHIPTSKTLRQQEKERQQDFPSPTPPHSPTPQVELEMFKTGEDEFGRFRIYHQRPTSELSNTPPPDHNDFAESGESYPGHPENVASGLRIPATFVAGLSSLIDLFMNATVALLIQWFCSGTGQKSTADVQCLIDEVILHDDFKAEDLQGVKLAQELKKLDTFESSLEGQGWKKGSVKISVPCPKNKVSEDEAMEFEVEGLLYQDLTSIIKIACQDEVTEPFHTTPFQEMWRPSDDTPPIRLYGEAYTSDEMISAYEEVQNIPPDPDYPGVEHVVVELAPYSDGTMLAQFGTAFLWPLYIYFGNLSKYIRCQPSAHAAHHAAYFPSVCLIDATLSIGHLLMNM